MDTAVPEKGHWAATRVEDEALCGPWVSSGCREELWIYLTGGLELFEQRTKRMMMTEWSQRSSFFYGIILAFQDHSKVEWVQ